MDVDRDEPGYLYETLARKLAERIRSGEFPPNSPLPAEGQLAQEHGVSLGTARHATRLLREWGLVVTIKSKGTYVTKPADKPPVRPPLGLGSPAP